MSVRSITIDETLLICLFHSLLKMGEVRTRALRSAKEHALSRMMRSISGGRDSMLDLCFGDDGANTALVYSFLSSVDDGSQVGGLIMYLLIQATQ